MRHTMKMTVTFILIIGATFQARTQRLPSGADVLHRLVQGVEGVDDYTVNLQADLHMEHIRIPRAAATMYFKKPDKIHFDSPSIALMPREGVAFNSAAVLEQYTAQMIGEDTAAGLKVYKLQLAAKSASVRLRQLFVWVDPTNWTMVRMQTIPYEGRILTVDFVYGLQEKKYWMPVSMDAEFGLVGDARTTKSSQADSSTAPENPADQMIPRAPRSGSLSITYSDYRINTGLSDDIFKPAPIK